MRGAGLECRGASWGSNTGGCARAPSARHRSLTCTTSSSRSTNRCSCTNCAGTGCSSTSCCSTSGRASSSSSSWTSSSSSSWSSSRARGSHGHSSSAHHGSGSRRQQQQRQRCVTVQASSNVTPFSDLDAAFVTMGPTYAPFSVVKRSSVAGGILEEVAWAGPRRLRVWLPPGYSPADACRHPYPVLFLNDGQNVFGDCTTISGSSWQAGEVAAAAITAGQLPPFVIVGIDHADSQRSWDYTPYVPGTGPGDFRGDAIHWPGGGVADYCDKVVKEVVPWVSATYHTSQDPAYMAFGGSSLGGVAALYMGLRYPGAFGGLLVESPSLWIGEERFLQDIVRHDGSWPQRVWVGMGGREFSGVRGGKGEENDLLLVGYATVLARTLTQAGLGRERLQWVVQESATHTESAWSERLPLALQFLGGHWWKFWEDRYAHELFFTVPRVLKAGMPAVVFFNRRVSKNLKQLPPSAGVNMVVGYNQFQQPVSLTLVPCGEVQTLEVPAPTDALFAEVYEGLMQHGLATAVLEWQREKERELRAARAAAAAAARQSVSTITSSSNAPVGPSVWKTKARATTGWRKSAEMSGGDKKAGSSSSSSSSSSSKSSSGADMGAAVKPIPSVFDSPEFYISNAATAVAVARDAFAFQAEPLVGLRGDWWMVQLDWVPDTAFELNFVFSDAAEAVWENAGDEDFWRPVRPQYKLLLSSEIKEDKKDDKKEKEKGAVKVEAKVAEKELVMAGGGSSSSKTSSSGGSGSSSATKTSSSGSSGSGGKGGSSSGGGGKGGKGAAFHSTSATLSAAVAGLATAAAMAAPDKEAAIQRSEVMFTMPATLVAGAAAAVYINRRRLNEGLDEAKQVVAQVSFNKWQMDIFKFLLQPTALKTDDHHEWLSFMVQVPKEAHQMDLAFCNDNQTIWDNNHGDNYSLPVASPAAAATLVFGPKDRLHVSEAKPDAAARAKRAPAREDLDIRTPRWRPSPRAVSYVKEVNHAGGRLTVLELERRKTLRPGQPKRSHWWDERRIRVWTPENFKPDNAPPGGWPVLYMADGEAMFEDWLSHSGVSWRLGYKMSQLIAANEVPPCVLVGVDSAGPYRPYNYLPYVPGTGVGGFRPEAKRWPGGGCREYLARLVEEVMPLVEERFNTSGDPSRVALGGGSFAGVSALEGGLAYPEVFGSVLAESPSLWIAEGAVLQDLADHTGRLPDRVYLGCGTREFSAHGGSANGDIDYLLTRYYHEAAQILRDKGLNSASRLQFVVEEGAAHHEVAWQGRLGGALKFVCGPWWVS